MTPLSGGLPWSLTVLRMRGCGGSAARATGAGTFAFTFSRVAPRAHLISNSRLTPTHRQLSNLCPQLYLTHRGSKQSGCKGSHQVQRPSTTLPRCSTWSKSPFRGGVIPQLLHQRWLLPYKTGRMASTTTDSSKWSANHVRDTFIKFFEEKGHTFGMLICGSLDSVTDS